jgi:predicted nicotinamide N-methyase
VLSRTPDADLVLIGDLVYEPELAFRVAAFLESVIGSGAAVLLGDRISARRPPMTFALVAEYEAPVIPELIDDSTERARVWRLERRPKPTRRKRS